MPERSKVPSSEVVWRGPAAKVQVTLSVSPSGWQPSQEPQPWPLRDQRARPVTKKRRPMLARSSALAAVGAGADWTTAAVACALRSMSDRLRVFSLRATAREPTVLATAMPMGRRPAAVPALRPMKWSAVPWPTWAREKSGLNSTRKIASEPYDDTYATLPPPIGRKEMSLGTSGNRRALVSGTAVAVAA